MKNLKELLDENNVDVTFRLLDSEFVVPAKRNIYKEILSKYASIASKCTTTFKEYLSQISNIDEFFASISDVFIISLEDGLNELAKDAISVGIFTLDSETILSSCISNGYFEPFEDAIELYQQEDNKIISKLSNATQYRENRKNYRSKWHSTTYGGTVFDAWGNQAKVGAMNAVEGLGHSVVNAIGNSIDESNANNSRKNLFQNQKYRKQLINGFYRSADNLRLFISNVISQNCEIAFDGWVTSSDVKEADAIYNNLIKFDITDNQKKELICKLFDLNPYNIDFYSYVMKEYPDNIEEVLLISDYFNIVGVKDDIIKALKDSIDKCGNTSSEYIAFKKDLYLKAEGLHLNQDNMLELNGVLENKGVKILSDYVDNHLDNSEETLIECKNYINKLKSEMGIERSISNLTDKLDEKLKKIDLDLRTIDGVTFNTRDEAANAKKEVEQNKDVLRKDDYICLNDYLEQISKIKQLSIHPTLIAEHIGNTNIKKHEFEEKCEKAKCHEYRMNHGNTILWDGNNKKMILRYGILLILALFAFIMSYNNHKFLSFVFYISTICAFNSMIVSKAKDNENAWIEVTDNGHYLLRDIMDPEKKASEISKSGKDYTRANCKGIVTTLGVIFTVLTIGIGVFSSSRSSVDNQGTYDSTLIKLQDNLNDNNVYELREVFYPDNFVNMSDEAYEEKKSELDFDFSSIDYTGQKWEIANATINKVDKKESEKEFKEMFGKSPKIKETYKATADIRFCYGIWENCEFYMYKTDKNQWAVSEDFFDFT